MAETTNAPLLISTEEAPGYPLTEYGPMSPAVGVPLDGPMNHRGVSMWDSADGKIITGLWECDAGRFRANFPDDGGETVHIVSGSMTCTADDGSVLELKPGDVMTFPPGWRGVWNCHQPLRKFYTVFKLG